MKIVAGIDICNATTETARAKLDCGKLEFLASGTVPTTGIKGTRQNINGVVHSLTKAMEKAGITLTELSQVCLNEAAPVIGDVAMETITETIITESTMIGHNPSTPGGMGIGVGETIEDLQKFHADEFVNALFDIESEKEDIAGNGTTESDTGVINEEMAEPQEAVTKPQAEGNVEDEESDTGVITEQTAAQSAESDTSVINEETGETDDTVLETPKKKKWFFW